MATAPSPTSWTSGDTVTEAGLDATQAAINFLRSPPRAQLGRASLQNVTNNTNTAVKWTTEVFDSVNGHDTSTNNERYVAQYDGIYQVSATIPWETNTVLHKVAHWFRVNGSSSEEFAGCEIMKTTSDITLCTASTTHIELTTGDYVEVIVWHNKGSNHQIDHTQHGGPLFDIRWVSA